MVSCLIVVVLKATERTMSLSFVSLGLTKELFRNDFTLVCFVVNLGVTNSEFLQFLCR